MVEVTFIFNQIRTVILTNLNDSFGKITNQFITKTNLDLNNLYFLSNGKNISPNEKIINVMSDSDKVNKKMTILVYSRNIDINIEVHYVNRYMINPILLLIMMIIIIYVINMMKHL